MNEKENVESFFRRADISWWNPIESVDQRAWFFESQTRFVMIKLLKYLRDLSGIRALDAGCGRGVHSSLLEGLGLSVTSLDINPDMLVCTRKMSNSDLVEGSILAMPFSDSSFDVVLSIGTSMHVSSVGTMIDEINRVLKKQGIAIVSMANRLSLYVMWTTRINSRLVKHQALYHRRQFTFWEFRTTLIRAGFQVLDVKGFAVIPPMSIQQGWRGNIIGSRLSRILSMPLDRFLGKYFGCAVTFVLRKTQ